MRGDRSIQVGEPRARRGAAGWRVEAEAAGAPLWFESPDAELDPAPEALAAAVLPVAAAHQARLVPAATPDATFLENTGRLLAVTAEWWGEPRDPGAVLAGVTPAPANGTAAAPSPAGRDTGLCFSGGVDSFHALLRAEGRVGTVILAHGYDIMLDDAVRIAAAERSLREVAAALGVRPVLIRTNLREHPLWRRRAWTWRRWRWRRRRLARWERVHGGALAACGHLLRRSIGELRIAASYPRAFDRPFGSHWRIDPLWSSGALRVAHVGAERWRTRKLLDIIDEPLVQRHLRVCWRNLAPSGNCGRCEKCVRTMLILAGAGRLERYPVFPGAAALRGAIEALPAVGGDLVPVYRAFLTTALPADVREATARLVKRSAGRAEGRAADRVEGPAAGRPARRVAGALRRGDV
jgi:hypothetical protein